VKKRASSPVRWGLALLLAAFSLGMAEQGAKYLIIAPDGYSGILKPLADWRTKKGIPAKIVTYSEAGGSVTALHNYIVNAYNTWPIRPEFICIGGAPSLIPAYNSSTDCYYGNMTGDYVTELPVGRLWATNARGCSLQVNKVLAYEKPSWSGDTLWFLRGTTTIREDGTPVDDSIYWNDSRTAHNYWIDRGYQVIDSFSSARGNNSTQVNTACSEGRTFVTYRGQGVSTWWSPFGSITPSSWTNGAKMPIAVGATCQTLTLQNGESMYADAFVGAGTPAGLGGAIAYFGTTGVTSHAAQYRGAVYVGFFNALFGEKNPWLGPATVRGRYHCDSLYHVQVRYEEWNLLGDPALYVWTAEPKHAGVTYDSVIPVAPQNYTVTVTGNGVPVMDAMVCVMMDTLVYATTLTNAAGQATLAINPPTVGTLSLTITGANLLPFETTIRSVVTNQPYLVANGLTIEDFVGNHDGSANPGERLYLGVGLHNLGSVTATGVSAVLRLGQSGLVVYDSTADYGTIVAESTVTGESFEIALDTVLAEGRTFNGTIHATDDQARSWDCQVSLVVHAGRVQYSAVTLLDQEPGGNNNGRLGRGEAGRVELAVTNAGGGPLAAVHALVRCLDTTVVLTDSTAWYGSLGAGQTRPGSDDWFSVQAPLSLPRNQAVTFRVYVWADGGTYRHCDTFDFQLQGESGTTGDPTGPDAYGYWCYDDTDTQAGHAPTYSWFDISTVGAVIPAVSDSDAATRQLALPFTFRHYGTNYDTISVCANGWLSMGYTTSRRGTNNPMPDTASATAMIAPFWDDLNANENQNGYGTAYQYYDEANHRFVVQFQDFAHLNQPSIRETFEAIFYDPAYYPTPTGDGEIVFQYNRVSLNSSCTIGIENQAENIGLQYLYNNSYAPTAAYLQANRALKFTTYPPNSLTQPWLVLADVVVSDAQYGNNNGILEPGEVLTVAVTVANSGAATATNAAATLRVMDADGAVQDSAATLGDIAVGASAGNGADPFTYQVAAVPTDSVAELAVALNADGYAGVAYFSFGLGIPAGVETPPQQLVLRTELERVRPNPVVHTAAIGYALAHQATVELALFDATGRCVRTLASGSQAAGRYGVSLPVAELSQGVYFCRLSVADGAGTQRFVRKLQVAK
jgi:hypothetical protein